ncbi:MAG: hypothetical protein MMC33_006667 [Icmadophila ericetorum]|nr:hypothetical protein [Icmadophila ericetorum]
MADAHTEVPVMIPDRSSQLYAAGITTWVIAVIALSLRILGRRVSGNSLWWDDRFIIIAMVRNFSKRPLLLDTKINRLSIGLGLPITVALDRHPTVFLNTLKGLYAAGIIFPLNIAAAKFSLLAFYWRIFRVPSIRIPIYILATIITSWFIAVFIIAFCACIPTAKFWDFTIHGVCINLHNYYLALAIANSATDFALLALPLPLIWHLQITNIQKLELSGAFVIGGFTCVVSVVRLRYIVPLDVTSLNITWNLVDFLIWTVVESSCSVISACLPLLRPALRFLTGHPVPQASGMHRRATLSHNALPRRLRSGSQREAPPSYIDKGNFTHLQDAIEQDLWIPKTTTKAEFVPIESSVSSSNKDDTIGLTEMDGGENGIAVLTEISWQTQVVDRGIGREEGVVAMV